MVSMYDSRPHHGARPEGVFVVEFPNLLPHKPEKAPLQSLALKFSPSHHQP